MQGLQLIKRCIIYLINLLERYIAHTTRRRRELTVTQTICIGLRFFACGAFLVGDAENIGKAAACCAVRRVYLALKRFLNVFITFPRHTRGNAIKEDFYAVAGGPRDLPHLLKRGKVVLRLCRAGALCRVRYRAWVPSATEEKGEERPAQEDGEEARISSIAHEGGDQASSTHKGEARAPNVFKEDMGLADGP
ncbi:UNVERIFIED_CONTAM: hypothetical protein FKN15_018520 [Acipenser sinensis]